MVEKINVTFLGTGSSIPTARRNHPAVLLKYKGENVLIDCGEGTQRQFRKAGLNLCKVTRILISHWHGDHVLGLPGLLQTLNLNGRNGELVIYGPRGSKRKFQEMVAPYLSRRVMGYEIVVREVCTSRGNREQGIGNREIIVDGGDFLIEAVGVEHDCPAVAYSFVVKEKVRLDKGKLAKLGIGNSSLVGELAKGKVVEIGGKRVDGGKLVYREAERKVSFVMDTRYDSGIVDFVRGADLLVSEATYSKEDAELAEEHGHLTSVGAARIAKKGKVGGLVLLHLSQRYDAVPRVIVKEAKEVFGNVRVVEDLDVVEL